MALSKQLQDRIEAVAADLRKELYGPKGCPPWGTKFVEMEEQTGEVGDALACVMLSQGLPEENEEESPRCKVADALRYLQNQHSRMRYDAPTVAWACRSPAATSNRRSSKSIVG